MFSKRRVLKPPELVSVLACIGSQTHSTCWPVSRTASIIFGRPFSTSFAPKRWMMVRRPGVLFGLSVVTRPCSHSAVIAGPIFTPMGLEMPRKNSTCAPSSAAVRMPIHGMCVDRLYPVSYTHLRAHETPEHLVCRLLLEKKK